MASFLLWLCLELCRCDLNFHMIHVSRGFPPGFAVVGEYSKEVAEGYCEGLRGAGIGCDVTKADSPE